MWFIYIHTKTKKRKTREKQEKNKKQHKQTRQEQIIQHPLQYMYINPHIPFSGSTRFYVRLLSPCFKTGETIMFIKLKIVTDTLWTNTNKMIRMIE